MRFYNSGLAAALAMLAGLVAAGGIGRQTAEAQQLVITEIWQHGHVNSTPDWFELTNFGGSNVNPNTLYYDDDSADPTENNQLFGITNLVPGESAIYLVAWHDDFPGADFPPPFDPTAAFAAFDSFWGTNGAYQIGYILDGDTAGGPGLGGGGDTVNIYDGNTAGAMLIDSKGYPDGSNEIPEDSNHGVTWVYNPMTMSDNLQHARLGSFGAFLSVDGTQIGSPGVAVPEPGSVVLVLLGVALAAIGCRRVR